MNRGEGGSSENLDAFKTLNKFNQRWQAMNSANQSTACAPLLMEDVLISISFLQRDFFWFNADTRLNMAELEVTKTAMS